MTAANVACFHGKVFADCRECNPTVCRHGNSPEECPLGDCPYPVGYDVGQGGNVFPGNEERSDETAGQERSPVPHPRGRGTGNTAKAAKYENVAELLNGSRIEPPAPALLHRADGNAVFYAGQVNLIFGDPESGKTWVALAAVVEALKAGRRALVLDMDHNGPAATVYRLLDMGAPEQALSDPAMFRYSEPEDRADITAVMTDVKEWRPAVAVVDSVGELLPMLGLSSNSPDDFTMGHTKVLKPLAMAGAAVLAIDHLPKNPESRANGPTGTAAKRRAVGGTAIRVTVQEPFTPGRGGSAYLMLNKDRHGGLRQHCPADGKEPAAGIFHLDSSGPDITWRISVPVVGDRPKEEHATEEDMAALDRLDPPPSTVRDVKERLRWNSKRAADALREWRSRNVPREQGTLPTTTEETT